MRLFGSKQVKNQKIRITKQNVMCIFAIVVVVINSINNYSSSSNNNNGDKNKSVVYMAIKVVYFSAFLQRRQLTVTECQRQSSRRNLMF